MGIFRRLFTGVGFLAFLLILLVAGWVFREEIGAWLANVDGNDIVVEASAPEFGPETAAHVDTALQQLAAGGVPAASGPAEGAAAEGSAGGDREAGDAGAGDAADDGAARGGGAVETRFTETELQSYVRYELATRMPAGVGEPAVELRDSTVAFSAMLHFNRLPIAPDAAATLARMLGDSARVAGEVLPEVGDVGEGRLHLVSLQAGVIPIPSMMLGMAARQLGLRMDGRTLLFDIPETVVEVRVADDEIIILMNR